jgi:hypothetical protein
MVVAMYLVVAIWKVYVGISTIVILLLEDAC